VDVVRNGQRTGWIPLVKSGIPLRALIFRRMRKRLPTAAAFSREREREREREKVDWPRSQLRSSSVAVSALPLNY